MAIYMITYDLAKPERDYPGLHKAIKESSREWMHEVQSTWIIAADLTAKAIVDKLKSHIDHDDKLLVMQIAAEWASLNLSEEVTEWLHRHVA